MKAICKLDYGQFELNKIYDYSYSFENNNIKYFVSGQYCDNEFNKKQFDTLFSPKNKKTTHNINYKQY